MLNSYRILYFIVLILNFEMNIDIVYISKRHMNAGFFPTVKLKFTNHKFFLVFVFLVSLFLAAAHSCFF